MPVLFDFTGAITAGGRSSRFGSDKALAVLRGRPLLRHVADSLGGCSVRLIVAPAGKYALEGWETVPDTRPGEGPLAGLEAALTHAPPGWLAFTGVDLPGLTPAFWAALAASRTPHSRAVLPLDPEGRPQPLAALYHRDLLPHIQTLLDAGERRLRLACPAGQSVHVGGLSEALWNVNTPAELARYIDPGP
ncbi:putative molybdenum cofactor guanylyltransferase [Deinococcus aerophilus]|uniref:Probable molybdenum cofactor guanylyltransferase n=1 Tax=Deinococcus aerophilus TaxID=522488 RepID=A0ABQ2GYB0_9DEIO|nr:molybdenum cofactor guanylyltransferase [Deinococcus aerophilus]GGM17327.1 putative molybdenum cofactor guanylyltransferase [Deinococcus aerophilus]